MNLTPDPTIIPAGESFTIRAEPPADRRFIQQLRVAKDPTYDELGVPNTALSQVDGFIDWSSTQNATPMGQSFTFEVNTMFYSPGTYLFFTFPLTYFEVTITAPDQGVYHDIAGHFGTQQSRFSIYDKNGLPLFGSLPRLMPEETYYLAINVEDLHGMSEKIEIDYYTVDGSRRLMRNMLTSYTFPEETITERVSFAASCLGFDMQAWHASNRYGILPFRTPRHLVYYEYDGQLQFRVKVYEGPDCSETEWTLNVLLDDDAALPAIPGYKHYAYEHLKKPYYSDYENYPLDKRSFRVVRIGSSFFNVSFG
jgi:hypothetical protein